MIFQLAILSVSPCDLLMRADAQRVQRAVREDTAVSGDGLALPVPFIGSYYLSIRWEDAHTQWLSVVILPPLEGTMRHQYHLFVSAIF